MHSFRLPFHLELNHVYAHAVRDADGWILIDTGFGTDESFDVLEKGLRAQGIGWRDLHTILLTHCHPDHMSWAVRIQDLSGAPILMHPREEAYLREMVERPFRDPQLEIWGTPDEMVDRVTEALQMTGRVFRIIKPDRCVNDGDRVGPFEAVWTPGHAAGHLCFYDRASRSLIAGDHVLPKITPHVGWSGASDALAEYLRSLEKVAALEVGTVVPSHGDPFGDLPARAREISKHHDWRCQMIRRAQQEGARTGHEVVMKLWNRDVFPLSPFNYRFAIYEVMAHLRYMERPE